MRRSAKLLLLAGCTLVLTLEGPRAFAALTAGWRGPYAGHSVESEALAIRPAEPARAVERLELARR